MSALGIFSFLKIFVALARVLLVLSSGLSASSGAGVARAVVTGVVVTGGSVVVTGGSVVVMGGSVVVTGGSEVVTGGSVGVGVVMGARVVGGTGVVVA